MRHYSTIDSILKANFRTEQSSIVRMETESKDIIEKQKLEVFGILQEALTVPYRNINFIIFSIITSLPLLCFLIYFESFLLRIIIETSGILVPTPHFNYDWPAPDEVIPENLNKDFAYKLIQLSLLYIIPLHLLELFNMLLTIDLASKIYKEEHSMSLKEMVDKLIHMRKLRGTFITSVYVLFWSTCILLGLIWLVINCTVFMNFIYNVFYAVLCGVAFVALLAKYLEWSAQWNMSIVISILEEVNGLDALVLSGYLNRGGEKRGRALMLVFFLWGLGLKLPCLFLGSYESGVCMILQTLLASLGNVIKWVACMVYFYDCKQRISKEKVDEDVRIVDTAVDKRMLHTEAMEPQ